MAKEKNRAFGDKIITGECRASFPKLAKPDDSQYGGNKYSVDGIFESEEQLKVLKEKCIAHAKAFYGTDEGIKFPWRDGNELNKYEGYEGNVFVRARTSQKPRIVNRNKEIIDPENVYGGAVVRLNVTPLAYQKEEKQIVVENGERTEQKIKVKGIAVLLNGVQFLRDAEPYGGSGDSGFDDAYSDKDSDSDNKDMF